MNEFDKFAIRLEQEKIEETRTWVVVALEHLQEASRVFLMEIAEKCIAGGLYYKGNISDAWREYGWTPVLIPAMYL